MVESLEYLGTDATPDFDVLAIGNVTVDNVFIIPHSPAIGRKHVAEDAATFVGGEAANTCLMIAGLGLKPNLTARFGGDAQGHWQRRHLEQAGCRTDGSLSFAGVNHHAAFIVVSPDGERTIFTYRDPQLTPVDAQVTDDLLRRSRSLYSDGTAPKMARSCLRRAQTLDIRTFLDTDSPAVLNLCVQYVDELIVPEHVAGHLTHTTNGRGLCEQLLRRGPSVVIITRGELGALVHTADTFYGAVPAVPTTVIDTTGAGDAFHGAYIAARLNGASVLAAAEFATLAGAKTCSHLGPRMPAVEIRNLAQSLPS